MTTDDSRVVIVTGAAGGVGASTVAAFRDLGAKVVAVDIDTTLPGLHAADDGVQTIVGDVSDPQVADSAVSAAVDGFGRLDVLVNNAAKFLFKPVLETSLQEWDDLNRINVRSTFLFSRAAARVMVEQGSGSIVNLASIAGLAGAVGQASYGATKGASIAFTRALAIELAPHNVRVNALAPGAINTNFVRDATGDDLESYNTLLEQIAAQHPLGRIARPSEIADAVVYLSSDAAAFITGTVLPIDGGWTAQ
ncbi:SDR family NAD(P)-dependent oxidoreductase [Gordonia sp. NPDC127522]|uniref:SDR family NAD(P)-dependent oxidoreductase n=1 Tax=Gordonia sp. NPDC127522 TaxID=3345390 RepID=UPI0036322912